MPPVRIQRILAFALFLLLTQIFIADDRRVDFDIYTDFSTLKTFAVGSGKVSSPKPELNNALVVQRVADAIRSQLLSKGLKETSTGSDIVATFYITSIDYSAQRGGPPGHSEGTLVVDLVDRRLSTLLWSGVYRDKESNAIKLVQRLPNDVKQLFAQYPPKQALVIPPRPLSAPRTVPRNPREAAVAALELIRSVREDSSFVGERAHPGFNISLQVLERAAKAVAEDDGRNRLTTDNRITAFHKELNDAADFASGIADNKRESPNARQRAVDLAFSLRSLIGN